MEVGKNNVLKFFGQQNVSFFIPVYQRPHAWKVKNCKQLLEDIVSIAKGKRKTHFLGSITYVSHEKGGHHEYIIIDGQQRITSIMLLLKALQTKISNPIIKTEISKRISLDSESKLRLKPSEKDEESFRAVMEDRNEGRHGSGESGIRTNYLCFLDELSKNEEILEEIYRAFEKLEIALISLENGKDDPQKVFESINSTGVSLSGVDLIRNYLLMDRTPAEQKRLYDRYWKPIEELDGDERGRFVEDYLRIYWQEAVVADRDKLYDLFKRHKTKKIDDLEELMGDIRNYARIYRVFIDSKFEFQKAGVTRQQTNALKSKIDMICDINFRVSYPFIMRLIHDFEQDELEFDDFDGMLRLLASYYTRRLICGLKSEGLNKVMYGLYRGLNPVSFNSLACYLGSHLFPDDDIVRQSFLEFKAFKNKDICKAVLLEIEKESNYEAPTKDKLEIEHFYPQKPTPQWRKRVGAEAEEIESKYIHTFGNLSLLAGKLNAKAQNNSFADKIKLFNELGSLHLNQYFSKQNTWTIAEIRERSKYLANRFCALEIFKDLPRNYRSAPIQIPGVRKTLDDDLTGYEFDTIQFRDGSWAPIDSGSRAYDLARRVIAHLYENHRGSLERFIESNQYERTPVMFWGEPKKETEKAELCVKFDGFYFWINSRSMLNVGTSLKKIVEYCGLNPQSFIVE